VDDGVEVELSQPTGGSHAVVSVDDVVGIA
jgi:hypothetical protein